MSSAPDRIGSLRPVSDGPYVRRAARVLLVDTDGRVLLLKFARRRSDRTPGSLWLTPGGGMEGDETPAEAAARELREETGVVVPPDALGPMVATTSGYARLSWATGVFRDDFFFVRTAAVVVDLGGLDARERTYVLGHRWWTLDELRATTDAVQPRGLAPLVADLVAGRIPATPVVLPWHH